MQVNQVRSKYSADSTKVNLSISVIKGEPVYWGKIEVKSDSIPQNVYRKIIFFNEADIFSRTILTENINAILTLASDSGFIFAEVIIDSLLILERDNLNRVDFTLIVKEGLPVTIDDIDIAGNSYTRDFVILRELPVKPGERYTRKLATQIPEFDFHIIKVVI